MIGTSPRLRTRLCRLATLVPVLAAVVGCASGRDGQGPQRLYKSRGSTLGSDLWRAPRGATIPPPSIGVDLVNTNDRANSGSDRPEKAVFRSDRGPASQAP
jgi:hypothetical protein